MARLAVYVRSKFCPDVARWRRWLQTHSLDFVELDIDTDGEAYARVLDWTGFESVPTLVIAPDDGIEPIDQPSPLRGHSPRALDRGTMLTEPNPGQIEPFLERNGIPFERLDGDEAAGDRRPLGRLGLRP